MRQSMLKRINIKPSTFGRAEMPFSEVCMHMGIAGKVMTFKFLTTVYGGSVQLYKDDGTEFSSPICASEAGIFQTSIGESAEFYYYSTDKYQEELSNQEWAR